jgi:hypothetical protein
MSSEVYLIVSLCVFYTDAHLPCFGVRRVLFNACLHLWVLVPNVLNINCACATCHVTDLHINRVIRHWRVTEPLINHVIRHDPPVNRDTSLPKHT